MLCQVYVKISNAFRMCDQVWPWNITNDGLYRLDTEGGFGNRIQAVPAMNPLLYDERMVCKLDPKDPQPHCPNPTNFVVDVEPILDCTTSGSGRRTSHRLHRYPVHCSGDCRQVWQKLFLLP
mmetsp:Transcript_935/g.5881  ORF Transcript_935/g.5881 Transcript_935/m.5881 type:complete len:122 (-) Transcript_935:794-1159(-)